MFTSVAVAAATNTNTKNFKGNLMFILAACGVMTKCFCVILLVDFGLYQVALLRIIELVDFVDVIKLRKKLYEFVHVHLRHVYPVVMSI
jgi:hypothetical protein